MSDVYLQMTDSWTCICRLLRQKFMYWSLRGDKISVNVSEKEIGLLQIDEAEGSVFVVH